MANPNVVFELTPVVHVCVQGASENRREWVGQSRELIGKLLQFLIDNEIHAAVSHGSTGNGRFEGFYTAEDAEKIKAWMKEQGVE